MAPSQPSRHLLAWSLPAFALFLSYFWFKKKRLGHQSDICGSSKTVNGEVINTSINVVFCEGSKKGVSENKPINQVNNESPKKPFSRSLSGVDSAPIDIVLPPDMRAAKSNQMIISDEDLDFEIEKIKSMRSTYDRQRSNNTSPVKPAIEFKVEKPASFESVPLTETKPVKKVEVEEAKEEEEEEEIETEVINIKVEEFKKEEVVQEVKEESPQVAEEVIETPKEVCKEDNIVEKETIKQEEIKKEEETIVDSPAPVQPSAETSTEEVSVKKNSTPPKSAKNKKGPNKQKDMAKKDVKPVQSDVIKLEEKFSAMKISGSSSSSSNNNNKKASSRKSRSKNWVPMNMKQQTEKKGSNQRNETQRKSTDRDSANHSPADIMIASRSLSNISDNGSSDSGKGGSDVATPPNYGPPHNDMYMRSDQLMLHEFEVPIELVGRLIGKKGAFVNQIKAKTNADIVVKSYPEPFGEQKICMVEGTPKEIDAALKMIRRKFPLESYPRLTLQSWSSSPIQLVPEKLKLIEGINNDTMVSCVDSPTHLFMQFPTHPSFPNLVVLHNFMQMCYQTESPELPNPIPVDAICAALSKDGLWYRAQILSADEENSFIRFLDWGGCEWVSNKDLRKIRYDFMLLPFQAAECILANLQPVGGPEAEWPEEAVDYVKEVSHNAIIYTQVADYTPDGIPLVLCFVNIGTHHVVNLNRDLVEKGYAEWIEPEGEAAAQ